MSIAAGILIMLIAGYTPALIPIGIFWPILLVGVPSAILGITGKIKLVGFVVGVLLGSSLFIAINFSSWGQLSVMLAFSQLLPTLSAILIFSVFWTLSPIKTHNNPFVCDARQKPPRAHN